MREEAGDVLILGFTDYLVGLGLSPKTVRLYVAHVKAADSWLNRVHTSLQWASATQVAEYASATLPFTSSTRRQAASGFRHYWEWIERERAPLKAVRVPPHPQMVCKALDEEEAHTLTKTAVGWWPKGTAVLFGLYLALRREEIAHAEWSRYDQEREWYTVTGKGSVTATLPVHPTLAAELMSAPRTDRWVFQGRWDGPVNPATIWSWTKEVAEAAGLGHVITHQLRHTSLATANDRLGDLRAVQTFARHAKPETTAGYTRTTQARLREVSDSLDYL